MKERNSYMIQLQLGSDPLGQLSNYVPYIYEYLSTRVIFEIKCVKFHFIENHGTRQHSDTTCCATVFVLCKYVLISD